MDSTLDEGGSSPSLFEISDEVIKTIARIETLGDITPKNLHSLKGILERTVSLPTFEVNLEKFKILHKQFVDFGLTGVEYDGRFSGLVLRPYSNYLVQAAVDGIDDWFQLTVEILQGEGHPDWICSSTRLYDLTRQYSKIVKEAHLSLSRINDAFPYIALCISCKEARMELMDDVKHWLYGTENNTQAVIAIEITERNCPDLKESWVSSPDLSLFKSAEIFVKDVIDMENLERPTMVGVFVASLWILTRSNLSDDAPNLPSPAYVYEYRNPSDQGLNLVTGCFSGSPCIHQGFSIQIGGTSVPLDLVQFEEKLLKGIVDFRNDRMSSLAISAWDQQIDAGSQSMVAK